MSHPISKGWNFSRHVANTNKTCMNLTSLENWEYSHSAKIKSALE